MTLCIALCAALCGALSVSQAAAAEPCSKLSKADLDEYLKLGEQATNHFVSKDYTGAVQALVQAMDICDEDPRVQYNLARAYHKANNCNQALFWYERILSLDPNSEVGKSVPDERARAGRYVTELQVECANSARVNINCSDQNVRLSIGDAIRNVKCPYSQRLDTGTYKLRADLEGHEPYIVSISLVAGENNRILIPALEKMKEAPTTGALRISCEEGLSEVILKGPAATETKTCNQRYDLPPGRYAISLTAEDAPLETVDLAIGETMGVSIRQPVAKLKRTGFLIGLRANPSIGFATGDLLDKNAENSIGRELAGVQPALPTFAMLVELGYSFTESIGAMAQARFDVTNLSVMATALVRWLPWYNDTLSLRLDLGIGAGSILMPVEIEDGQRPLAKSGPVFGQLGVGLGWRFNPLLSLVTMLETRLGFPNFGVPIDLSVGIEVQF
jgi:hypothetical protein